jgi:hypothetical protein
MPIRRLTPEELRDRHVLQNSIERVINTTLKVLEHVNAHLDEYTDEIAEAADVNLQDWEELKATVVAIFNEERNRAFERAQAKGSN